MAGGILLAVYVLITIVFFGLLLVSLIFGGDHDFGFDTDLDLDGGGMSPMSLPVISVFMTTLGAMGTILTYQGVHPALTPIISIVVGGIVSGIAFWLILNVFVKTQSNTMVKRTELIGEQAEVTISIKPDRAGQIVVVTQARGRVNFTAYSDRDIPVGSAVIIKEKRADGFLVEPS